MNFIRRRKILKSTNSMHLIPVRTMGHEQEDGLIIILVPKFQSAFMKNLFPGTRKMFYRIKLDKLGSETWKIIDGELSVQEIADQLRELDSLKDSDLSEIEERLSKYMSELYERRYITFRQLIEEE